MTYTRLQSLARARAKVGTRYDVGACWRFTREQFGRAAFGDYDGDGRADAEDAWKAAKLRHPGDRNPPPGVPVFWAGGSKDDGHAAVSAGSRRIIGTDAPKGFVGETDLDYPERAWGLTYLGWTEDIKGEPIPLDATPDHKPKRPAHVRAWLKEMRDRLKTAGPAQARKIRAAMDDLKRVKKR